MQYNYFDGTKRSLCINLEIRNHQIENQHNQIEVKSERIVALCVFDGIESIL
jgi:hypothetical protein